MGRSFRLPRREVGKTQFSDMQLSFLDMYIFGLGDMKMIFRLLLAPGSAERTADSMMRTLLNNSAAIEYMEARKRQIERFFCGDDVSEHDVVERKKYDESDIRKIMIDTFSEDIVDSIKNGTFDYKKEAIFEKMIVKILEKEDEKVDNGMEPPRIYLPESCSSCRYRKAIEESDGDVIDECIGCRYRKDCLDRGVEFDPKTQIDYDVFNK